VCMHMAKFDPTYDLKRLNSDSLIFYDALNDLADGLFEVNGWGCRGAFTGDYYLYFQQMAKAKILFGPSIFINFDSVKCLSEILEYSQIALDNIINNRVKLEGEKPTSAFSSQMRKKS